MSGLFSIQVVLIEDNPDDTELIRRALNDKKWDIINFNIVSFSNMHDSRRYLTAGKVVDIVLLDLTLPNSTGIETFKKCYELIDKDIPIIVLSGEISPDILHVAIQLGAYHCLDKSIINNSHYLQLSVFHAVERSRARMHLSRLQRTLTAEFKQLIGSCANCHRWRLEATTEWLHPEKYIEEMSEIAFSHSICPDCTKKLYGNINEQ